MGKDIKATAIMLMYIIAGLIGGHFASECDYPLGFAVGAGILWASIAIWKEIRNNLNE